VKVELLVLFEYPENQGGLFDHLVFQVDLEVDPHHLAIFDHLVKMVKWVHLPKEGVEVCQIPDRHKNLKFPLNYLPVFSNSIFAD
jgi:hypothetical protein